VLICEGRQQNREKFEQKQRCLSAGHFIPVMAVGTAHFVLLPGQITSLIS